VILIDTNIAARSVEKGSPHQLPALDAIEYLRKQRQEYLVVVPQVIIEFHAIATRRVESNGLGFTPEVALQHIDQFKSRFGLFVETPDIFLHWERLVAKYKPRNRVVFDLRLVAAMLTHGMPQILTFNDQDFVAYREIQALNPFDVLGISRV
jgi:predicted nucleic acid-binding protein